MFGWSDVSQCQACQKEEGTEKHRLYHCPEFQRVGAKSKNLKEGVEMGKRYCDLPLSVKANGTGVTSV